jgi:hypothetical protein
VPFTNPLVAGTTLIRTAIHSPNYVQGVSGWTINKDGSAEFNNVTVRGALYVMGNNGSYVNIYTNGTSAVIDMQPPVAAGFSFQPTEFYTTSTGNQPFFEIDGPQVLPSTGYPASVTLGQIGVGATNSVATLTASTIIIGDKNTLNTFSATRLTSHNTNVEGILSAANRVTGTVSIVPVANVPTSVTVTFSPPLLGTSFTCQVSANTTLPGTRVTGVSYSSLSASGVTLWITRTDTTSTGLSYTVGGIA